jgi:uncharacterized protein YkwD
MPQPFRIAPLAAALAIALAGCQSVLDLGGNATGAAVIEARSGTEALDTIRSSRGLKPLKSDRRLERAALQQATYMAKSGAMKHTTRRGRDFAARVADNGIPGAAAENIAHGRFTTGELFSAWMNSSGHRKNMLDPRFTKFGLASVAESNGSGLRYWALVLSE